MVRGRSRYAIAADIARTLLGARSRTMAGRLLPPSSFPASHGRNYRATYGFPSSPIVRHTPARASEVRQLPVMRRIQRAAKSGDMSAHNCPIELTPLRGGTQQAPSVPDRTQTRTAMGHVPERGPHCERNVSLRGCMALSDGASLDRESDPMQGTRAASSAKVAVGCARACELAAQDVCGENMQEGASGHWPGARRFAARPVRTRTRPDMGPSFTHTRADVGIRRHERHLGAARRSDWHLLAAAHGGDPRLGCLSFCLGFALSHCDDCRCLPVSAE